MIVRDLVWPADLRDGRIRTPSFVRRSSLAVEYLAAMARAAEQCVARVLGVMPRVDVFPPVVLEDDRWTRVCEDAFVLESGTATIVIARRDAKRVVAFAFGETVETESCLSALEMRVFERFVEDMASELGVVCSDSRAQRSPRLYCELRLREPLGVTIGVAVCEPQGVPGPRLAPNALDACPIECTVHLGVATADIFTIADLAVGNVVRLETKVGPSATLNLGPDPIAAGEGGVLGERCAFRVNELL